MSFLPVTASPCPVALADGIRAIRRGYAGKPIPDPDQIVCEPWSRRDVGDMLSIRDSLEWLLAEIKAGYEITEPVHGQTIRHVLAAGAALDWKEREYFLKAGFNPAQPRVPRGNTDGGQWTDAGGGSLPARKPKIPSAVQLPHRKPPHLGEPHPHADSPFYDPRTGIYDPPINSTWSPFDLIGAPAKPVAGAVGSGARAAYNAARAAAVRSAGRQQGREFLKRQGQEALTDHGALRVGQRLRSQQDVNEAVETAMTTGKITDKVGKYGTRQFHYQGENGLTVIIETEGRNAGKAVTTFGKKPGGKQ